MLRALWFLIKASLLVSAIIWLTAQPGSVNILWQGYEIKTTVGFAAIVIALLLLVWAVLYGIWRKIVAVPEIFLRYREKSRRESGYRTVTAGLVAIAAGDAVAAQKCANRAEKLIPDVSLTRLLVAQAALMNGNAPKARREFAGLLEDEDAAFFGVRGLLQETLSHGDYQGALALARKAADLQPKRSWVIKTLFELETRNGDWLKAEATLKKAEKLGIFDLDAARKHRQAIFTVQAQDYQLQGNIAQAVKYSDKAFDLDPGFVPAAVLLAKLYIQKDKRSAAQKTLLTAWEKNPHPDLAGLWMKLMPAPKHTHSPYDFGKDALLWIKELALQRPDHRESYRALGAAALQGRLWREARENLTKGADYRSLARLEHEETRNDAKAREWLEIAADNPPDHKWVCHACGAVTLDWTALCRHCKSFNLLDWRIPSFDPHASPKRAEADILSPPTSASAAR